jgi:hypothetical protein
MPLGRGHSNNNVELSLASIGAWHALLCGSHKDRILPDQCRAQQISGLPAVKFNSDGRPEQTRMR